MRRIHLAEIQASWRAWLSVSVVFVTINASLTMTAMTYWTGHVATQNGQMEWLESAYYTISQVLITFFILLIALPVIGSTTALVVDSRRGALARLSLAGATPRQVRSTITSQLIAVSLASAIVGAVIAVAFTRSWITFTAIKNGGEEDFVLLEPVISMIPILFATTVCVLASIVAGFRQAHAASRIPPVEALRLSQAPARHPRLTWAGWLKATLLFVLVAASWVSVNFQVQNVYKETISNLFILSYVQIFVWAGLLSVVAPVLVRPVTRAWTRLIPSRDPAWILARSTVAARADRLYKSVVPVMFTFTIGVGALVLGNSGMRTIAVHMNMPDLEAPTLTSYAYLFGLPLIIAFAAGVASLIMMSKQRDAELALVAISGATPTQRIAAPALEALIITVTSFLLSIIAVVPSTAFQAYALSAAGLTWMPDFPWGVFAAIFAGGLVLTAVATVLPTLPSLRLPEPRVIARLVAE
ncbi:MAG: hypothetical protein QM705_09780 [Ancrocorticia sp.]